MGIRFCLKLEIVILHGDILCSHPVEPPRIGFRPHRAPSHILVLIAIVMVAAASPPHLN